MDMKLYTNIGSQKYGDYFVVNKKELYENYKAEKLSSSELFPFVSFADYIENSDWNELVYIQNVPIREFGVPAKIYQSYPIQTNVANNMVEVRVFINNKRNILDYEENLI